MGAEFWINDRGEIVRKNYPNSGSDRDPQNEDKKRGKGWILPLVLILGVVVGVIFLIDSMQGPIYHQEYYDNSYSTPTTHSGASSSQWSYDLRGNVGGNMAITMHLTCSNNNYSGWYYYNKNGYASRLTLSGYKASDGTVILDEYNDSGDQTGRFRGYLNDEYFTGTLYVYWSGKSYNFTLYN